MLREIMLAQCPAEYSICWLQVVLILSLDGCTSISSSFVIFRKMFIWRSFLKRVFIFSTLDIMIWLWERKAKPLV
jgi:hypothetical protein